MSLPGQLAFAISSGLSVIPAAILIYLLLRHVYHKIDDKRLYFMLGMSLIAGVAVGLFQTLLGSEAGRNDIIVIVMIALLFSLFENLVKVVLLNLKRFRQRPETTFYGASFVITGAMVASLHGFRIFRYMDSSPSANNTTGLDLPGGAGLEPYYIAGFIMLLFGSIFYHGAMGIMNGYFSSKGRFWTLSHLLRVVAFSFPFNFLLFWWYMSGFLDILVLGVATVYSAIILYHSTQKYYPLSLSGKDKNRLERVYPWKKRIGIFEGMRKRMRDIEEKE